MLKLKILSFDIESCNGNSKEASLCSFGYCLTDENFNILEQKDIIVNPASKRFTLLNFKGTKGIKLAYEEKINNLEYKLDEYLGQNQVLLDYIQSKIKIDEEKVKKTNELLEHLMPKQTEEGE